MWTPKILTIAVWLQTAASSPFVTNKDTGISYNGTSANEVDQFQSIFYAEDTSGANRFAPPVPYLPACGSTIQATAKGYACPQSPTGLEMYPFDEQYRNSSEDCLSLRIARPANQTADDTPLPVMVWFHGGGATFGSAYDRVYEPVGLIQESVASGHPVLWVGVNYRIGFFGLAASQELEDAKSLNVGLRDQRVALQWVKDNIAAFGGDPDNISIYGESFGGTSSALHLTAYGGEQGAVFTKAMVHSASYNVDFSNKGPFQFYDTVADYVNCSSDQTNSTLACLRSVPFDTLLSQVLTNQTLLAPPNGIGVNHPVIDGDFIPSHPTSLILNGSFVKGISVVFFWNQDDGTQFVPPFVNSNETAESFLTRNYGNATRDQLLSLYPLEDFEAQAKFVNNTMTSQYYRVARIQRDYSFTCPSINITYELARQSTNQTYLWFLNVTRSQPIWDAQDHSEWQIAHTSDIPCMYNNEIEGGDNSDSAMQLSAQITRSYSAFAHYGSPSTADFDWPVAWNGQQDGGGNATVFVIGGPYASGAATLGPAGAAAAPSYFQRSKALLAQLPLVDSAFRGWDVTIDDQRSEALAQEKLYERCAFIDTIPLKVVAFPYLGWEPVEEPEVGACGGVA